MSDALPADSVQGVSVSAIIFDVGNVLYGWDPEAFLARQVPEDEARLRFIEDVDLWSWHDSLDGGRPFDEAASELSERFPDYAHLIAAWGDRFGETITDPVPGVHAIVEELDAHGVPLFAITNFSADFWPPFHARQRAFFARFRDIVVSGEEKLLKPDPALYFRALDRFGVKPAEALFVDDRRINVEGAIAVGMKAHLFVDADDLRARLEAEGLL
ncbi:MAG: family phosphatase [Alphaproteobacteria bacterium]|nr:family phosphatase [Alphaproteobacteria bacterium]